jgi:hypothetical protein
MKKILIAMLALASMATAHATDMPERQLNFVAGVGFTYGGDKLASGTQANNDLRAGKGLLFTVGADYRVNAQFSLQSTIGLHIDAITSSSDDYKTFKRTPVEVLAYFHPSNKFRMGAGVRYAGNASHDANYYFDEGDMDTKVGAVIEGEFLINKHVGIKLRYVNEKFTAHKRNGAGRLVDSDVKGNHFGVVSNFYF